MWMQGWVTVFAWQAVQTSLCFQLASQIQTLAVLNYPDHYNPQRWQETLIVWAMVVVSYIINVYGIRLLPSMQVLGAILHFAFFIAMVIPLILLAPRSTPDFVFTQLLRSDEGWQSPGVAWCLGMLTVTFCFLGEPLLFWI